MNKLKLFVPLSKSEDQDDGSVMVYGYASTETLDHQGEIVKSDAVKNALSGYMEFANIREMHQPSAVGVTKSADMDDVGLYIAAKIVDPVAVMKVKEGVYKGFSIGGKATERVGKTITAMRMSEISLVDRPANPDALIEVWKMDGEPGDDDDEDAPFNDEDVTKGLWNAARLLEALSMVKSACEDAEFEQKRGEHSEAIIESMKAVKQSLASALTAYITEEISPAEKADTESDIAKGGARFSKGTKAALGEIHGMMKKCDEAMTKMGYMEADEDDAEKADNADDIKKLADAHAATLADIAKALSLEAGADHLAGVGKVIADLTVAKARIAELEAMPEPAKGNVMAVEKADDGKTGEPGPVDQLADALDGLDPNQIATAVMKHIHSQGARPIA